MRGLWVEMRLCMWILVRICRKDCIRYLRLPTSNSLTRQYFLSKSKSVSVANPELGVELH